jgi:D-sedoheptulose 7-phosphate isomerase
MRVVGTAAIDTVDAHFARSRHAAAAFFDAHAGAIAVACERLAERFARGGALFVLGSGAQATDAHHVAVEFVHPVIVGKRALPAIALTSDAAVVTGAAATDSGSMFAAALPSLARPRDVALALCGSSPTPATERALDAARARGLLTLAFSGGGIARHADVAFGVPGQDAMIVQEVHETLYHVLWELVHVFLEHDLAPAPGRDDRDGVVADPERALYPFLFDDTSAPSLDAARREVQQSIRTKSRHCCALRGAVHDALAEPIAQTGLEIAARVLRGGRILAFGNGGSATDAQDAVADCMIPPVAGWRPIPALALTNDIGVVTAVANDVGFEHVYARQVAAFGGPDDVAIGISTSGTSRSVIAGLAAAKARGLLTIALSGNDGGNLARSPAVDVCLTAPSDYTPRIQEAHATIWHAMLSVAQLETEEA